MTKSIAHAKTSRPDETPMYTGPTEPIVESDAAFACARESWKSVRGVGGARGGLEEREEGELSRR
jgi:hypothetical protein